MNALRNTFLLLLAAAGLASCGGGGGQSHSAFGGVGPDTITVVAQPSSITTNSFTSITVTVKKYDGSPENENTTVSAQLSPASMGSVTGAGTSNAGGSQATNLLSGGKASFVFNSTNQTGTATLTFSIAANTPGTGAPNATAKSIDIAVTGGNTQDPRLQMTASTRTLPLNPLIGLAERGLSYVNNSPGSPYVAEVNVTWRRSNGQLVTGTLQANTSIAPVNVATFSQLDLGSTPFKGLTNTPPDAEGNEFLTLLGSGPVDFTGGVGTIFVHSGDVAGTATLTVTAQDPDSKETISSQLTFTVVGSTAPGLPTTIVASSDGAAYISGSNGPQSTVLSATVYNGSNSFVVDPAGVDNVQFTIAGPANNDGRLVALNAAGQQNSGATVVATTHSGVATATFLTGTQQGPVQIKMTTDRADNNVDNGISDPVSATTTVVVSDGKLYSLRITSPDVGTAIATGVSPNVVESPAKSGNYEITVSAIGVDRQGNPALPGTVIAFGDVDSPQVTTGTSGPQGWFQISGSQGDPQEGGKLFTALDGHFLTAGGGAGPGDTLLVIGKALEGAPANNDDLESSDKITSVLTEGSLTVATPFNLNDNTQTGAGRIVNNGPVLPYIIGRATFSSIESPSFTDTSGAQSGVATTTMHYPASALGKAVAIWAQGTGTNANSSPGLTDMVTDVAVFVLPGQAAGAYLTASPDPIRGNTQVFETVCYYDGNNRPIPNYDISFGFNFTVNNVTVGSGSADGVSNSGKFQHLTGPNGCVTVSIVTASIPPTKSLTDFASITFSAGPINNNSSVVTSASATTVTVPIIVSAAQLQTTCTTGVPAVAPATGLNYSITLTLVDSAGAGMPGQAITAQCSTGLTVLGGIQVTDQTGHTTVTINDAASAGGTCTFQSTSFPNLVAKSVVTSTGGNTCSGGFSPPPN